jgi:hypothetical protein
MTTAIAGVDVARVQHGNSGSPSWRRSARSGPRRLGWAKTGRFVGPCRASGPVSSQPPRAGQYEAVHTRARATDTTPAIGQAHRSRRLRRARRGAVDRLLERALSPTTGPDAGADDQACRLERPKGSTVGCQCGATRRPCGLPKYGFSETRTSEDTPCPSERLVIGAPQK